MTSQEVQRHAQQEVAQQYMVACLDVHGRRSDSHGPAAEAKRAETARGAGHDVGEPHHHLSGVLPEPRELTKGLVPA